MYVPMYLSSVAMLQNKLGSDIHVFQTYRSIFQDHNGLDLINLDSRSEHNFELARNNPRCNLPKSLATNPTPCIESFKSFRNLLDPSIRD